MHMEKGGPSCVSQEVETWVVSNSNHKGKESAVLTVFQQFCLHNLIAMETWGWIYT